MLQNTKTSWGSVSKSLHWVMLLLIIVEVASGFLMSATYGFALKYPDVNSFHDVIAQIHHTNGFFLLLLVVFRLVWRFKGVVPQLPSGFSRFKQVTAKFTHGLLYALLLLVPLSGWAALSVLADSAEYGITHIWFFASDGIIPQILPNQDINSLFGYSFFGKTHRYLLVAGGVIVAIHVLASLWHHLVRKDQILLRMWPGGR
ncbi:cytochrome b/b6 domain-containing protein [Aliiglaciecola sp. 3_MG-2023]|uniref:cytochrome b n=1 Tax=Aliiglaciecola sp. 3_MG-2023 TaxID=3062644 RepID=UPI0026E44A70|nr:cytochrome b/b6 domain-containing protein [Aliiglaciecola sp. 3_MG-2023]MDO6691985.1 cytochrome b/b6 domain-containing protein [Aliiglaciecola sp. 3_MG-2023]